MEIKNCNNCDHTLETDLRHTPCRHCLSHRGLGGWRPMRLMTRLRKFWRGLLV